MGEQIWPGLEHHQAQGLACVVCGADYLSVGTPHRPVGRAVSGSQVFACTPTCATQAACPHTEIYSAADSGLAPLPWTVRTHGARDLAGIVFRAHVGQCTGCGARFAQVRTWTPDQTRVWHSVWTALRPAPPAGTSPTGGA